jgi:hypothetical protein
MLLLVQYHLPAINRIGFDRDTHLSSGAALPSSDAAVEAWMSLSKLPQESRLYLQVWLRGPK